MNRPELNPQFNRLLELEKPYVIMGIGLPGSGKSEYLRELSDLIVGSSIINIGAIRGRLIAIDDNAALNAMTWNVVYQRVMNDIESKRISIIDASNTDRDARKKEILRFRTLGSTAVVGCYIKTPSMNVARKRKPFVPIETLREWVYTLEKYPPTEAEGYDFIIEELAGSI